MWQSFWKTPVLNIFSTLTLKHVFCKMKTFLKNWIVESIAIENATFQYKIALSNANVKANRMGCTEWIYCQESNFTVNYFIFLKTQFDYSNPLQIVDSNVQTAIIIMSIITLFISARVLFEDIFPLWVSLIPALIPWGSEIKHISNYPKLGHHYRATLQHRWLKFGSITHFWSVEYTVKILRFQDAVSRYILSVCRCKVM